MDSTDLLIRHFSHWTTVDSESNCDCEPEKSKLPVRVKELNERDRRRILMHFLALDDNDRVLRFGTGASDKLITRYVQKMDLVRDTVLGVYDHDLKLVGVGHLNFASREVLRVVVNATATARIAEFGVSVLTSARGSGIGSKLFERAAIHCRNKNINTLYMHCLVSSQAMMHIAEKAGMTIHRDDTGANAYMTLQPANSGSVLQEAADEQAAALEYNFNTNTHAETKWMKRLSGSRRS